MLDPCHSCPNNTHSHILLHELLHGKRVAERDGEGQALRHVHDDEGDNDGEEVEHRERVRHPPPQQPVATGRVRLAQQESRHEHGEGGAGHRRGLRVGHAHAGARTK